MEESHEKGEERTGIKKSYIMLKLRRLTKKMECGLFVSCVAKKITMRYSFISSRWNEHVNTVLHRDSKARHEH